MKRIKKMCALALMGGMVLQFGGCLNLGGILNPRRIVRDAASFAVSSFLLDNPTVFDLFPENAPAAAPAA